MGQNINVHSDNATSIKDSSTNGVKDDEEGRGRAHGQGKMLDIVVTKLTEVAPPVAKLVKYVFGPSARIDRPLLKRYITLLEQPDRYHQLAAEESAMQMVNEDALENLSRFVNVPSLENATALIDIPALLLVIEGELRIRGRLPIELHGV
ncbi:hypothetical protein MPER_03039, partial [Moniliophthora perniciosa FA553]